MSGAPAAAAAPMPVPLNAVWYDVVKPTAVVLGNGQPALNLIASCETLGDAINQCNKVPGSAIIQHTCVHVHMPALAKAATSVLVKS